MDAITKETRLYNQSFQSPASTSLTDITLDGLTILQNLKGHWQLQRRLDKCGTMCGEVVFTKLNDEFLVYHEAGYVYLDHSSRRYKASKAQLYTYNQEKLLIYTYNQETLKKGDLLHTLDLSTCNMRNRSMCFNHEYVCKEDVYQLDWILVNPNKLKLNYVITGPYKSYTIQTTLVKK